ncbi:MAG: hypothetical protein WCE87_16620 [Candidatus Udaeobacter sp.]
MALIRLLGTATLRRGYSAGAHDYLLQQAHLEIRAGNWDHTKK